MRPSKNLIKIIPLLLCLALLVACGRASAPSDSGAESMELTMACSLCSADLAGIVGAYNKGHPERRIRLVKYDRAGDMERLVAEMAAGSAPDIFAFYGGALEELEGSAAFEDLLPYLDADPRLDRETLVESLFSALTEDGTLYMLPFDFGISTFYTRDLERDAGGFTMQAAREAAAELDVPLFPPWITRRDMLVRVYSFATSRFIDWEAGVADLESADFKALLEMCKQQPEEAPEDEDVMSLPSLLRYYPLDSFAMLRSLAAADWSFVGFPTEAGGVSLMEPSLRFYMYSAGERKEAAWEFLAFTLGEEAQALCERIPATRKALDAAVARGLEEGEKYRENGLPGLGEADAERFLELVNTTAELPRSRAAIYYIMIDEAAAYFANDRTIDECAAAIQSRVSLYLAEKM